jgi:hypothetical protein
LGRIVEIRSYKLKPGTLDEFHRLVTEFSLPMLARWKLDVVRSGPSLHDDDSYFLMRSFADMAERERQEEAFYGSDEWRLGPRAGILALIESYGETVFEADEAVVEALRR